MNVVLKSNSVQKIRSLLDDMGLQMSPFSGSSETVKTLISQIRRGKADALFRDRLSRLINELECFDAVGLPAVECEPIDVGTLADELQWALQERQQGPGFALQKSITSFVATASLLIGVALAVSCGDESETSSEPAACADDTSSQHFGDMAGQGPGLDDSEIGYALDEYSKLSDSEKEEVIAHMCKMDPDDIAQFIENVYKGDSGLEDADKYYDDSADYTAIYKGVEL